MKKFFKVLLRIVLAIVAVFVLFLGTTSIINVVATNVEDSNRQDYGEKYTVDGKTMNIAKFGTGAKNIVLLPGQGTASPVIDFMPLVRELEKDATIYIVEPFGYGLSDPTDKPRTSENIAREVHEGVAQLGLDSYVLGGHSIAGIYALTYVAEFGSEVEAFIGIDTSVPTQPGMDKEIPIMEFQALKGLGMLRFFDAVGPDPYKGMPYSQSEKDQMTQLSLKHTFSDTMTDEIENIYDNFTNAQKLSFPKSLPVLLFAQSNNADFPTWVELHEEQAASVDNGKVIEIDADHYLHHTHSPEIAADIKTFLATLK